VASGCKLQHLDAAAQVAIKRVLEDSLAPRPVRPDPFCDRSKARRDYRRAQLSVLT
jgi:tRNA/tmRNA/rRNA uracil-C5-methylase (TrmA/RlmC/RlmD family)